MSQAVQEAAMERSRQRANAIARLERTWSVACPTCGVPVGSPCVTAKWGGWVRRSLPHTKRIQDEIARQGKGETDG